MTCHLCIIGTVDICLLITYAWSGNSGSVSPFFHLFKEDSAIFFQKRETRKSGKHSAHVTDSLPAVQALGDMKAASISLGTSPLWWAPYSLGRQPALRHQPDLPLLLPPHSTGSWQCPGRTPGAKDVGQLLQEGDEKRGAEKRREAEGRAGTSETESICLH